MPNMRDLEARYAAATFHGDHRDLRAMAHEIRTIIWDTDGLQHWRRPALELAKLAETKAAQLEAVAS
jgi:hypothetical protein